MIELESRAACILWALFWPADENAEVEAVSERKLHAGKVYHYMTIARKKRDPFEWI